MQFLKFNNHSFFGKTLNKFLKNKFAFFNLVLILIIGFLCLLVPIFSKYNYKVTDFQNSLTPPNTVHLFGSDGLGRDLFVRCFVGGKITFEIAIAGTIMVLLIGVTYGTVSGFIGGKVDSFMMRIVDILYGLPIIFFSILLLSIFGQNIFISFIAIASVSWLDMARVVRGQTLSIKNKEFIDAARISGASNWRIIKKYIIPNLSGVILVYTTLIVPNIIILSAVLSFFGLGVNEPMTTWGLLINDGVQDMRSWWLLFFPTLLMVITLLSFSFVANGLKESMEL